MIFFLCFNVQNLPHYFSWDITCPEYVSAVLGSAEFGVFNPCWDIAQSLNMADTWLWLVFEFLNVLVCSLSHCLEDNLEKNKTKAVMWFSLLRKLWDDSLVRLRLNKEKLLRHVSCKLLHNSVKMWVHCTPQISHGTYLLASFSLPIPQLRTHQIPLLSFHQI